MELTRAIPRLSAKRHPQYFVLQGLTAVGLGMAALYGLRQAKNEPEVCWRRNANPEPWNEYADKQYKFLSAGRDYSSGCPAPRFNDFHV